MTPEPARSFDNTLIVAGVFKFVVTSSLVAVGPDKAVTDKLAIAVLLFALGSGVVLDTVAVLFNAPEKEASTLALIFNVAVAPLANVPIVHVGAVHVPTEGVVEFTVRFDEIGSETATA